MLLASRCVEDDGYRPRALLRLRVARAADASLDHACRFSWCVVSGVGLRKLVREGTAMC